MTPRLPGSKRMQINETLDLTLLEMSRKIRSLQHANSRLRASRELWRERARIAERRIR